MAQGLRDPYAVKGRFIRVSVEKVAHFVRIQLDKANASMAKFDRSIWIYHFLTVNHLFPRQLSRHLHLPSADGQPNDGARMLFGQMACSATNATPDVKHGSAGR